MSYRRVKRPMGAVDLAALPMPVKAVIGGVFLIGQAAAAGIYSILTLGKR